MKNEELNKWVGGISFVILIIAILGMALFPTQCAHAAIYNLKCGEKRQDLRSRNWYYAPKCPSPCPQCPQPTAAPVPTPTPKPTATPVPVPTAVPTPVPTPIPPQPPSTGKTLGFVCSTWWGYGNRATATSAQLAQVDKLRGYCDIVLTWWEWTAAQTWCPYVLNNSPVDYCGPYTDLGYLKTADNIYKDILSNHPSWLLKTSSGQLVMNLWTPNETPPDIGNPAYVDYFINYFANPTSYAGQDTFTQRKWNLQFLDNFVIRTINNNAWNSTPVNPRTGQNMTNEEREADFLKMMQKMRAWADANGVKYIVNVWSDVLSDYFGRAIYPQLMNLVDYALLEVMTDDGNGNYVSESVWLTRVKTAQAMAKNNRAIPVITIQYGNAWYNLASGLLACEPGKCMVWNQNMLSDDMITKLKALDLGNPKGDFGKVGCYIRAWDNGFIAANSMTVPCTVTLAGSYRNVETGGTESGTVTLAPHTGRVWERP